jgi:hypothetical protein
MGTLKPADDPLDFIKQNLRSTPEPVQVVIQQDIPTQVVTPPPSASTGQSTETPQSKPVETKEGEQPSNDLLSSVTKEKPTKEQSLAHLRKKAESFENLAKQHEAKVLELEAEVARLKKLEEDELPKVKDRVKSLEHYEKLYALELSPEYQEQYLKPIEQAKERLKAIGAEYEIPQDIMEQASTITNKKQLNQFLIEHFDELGALEVKNVINDIQNLQTKAEQAKKQPAIALEEMRQNAESREMQDLQVRTQKITHNATQGWIKALNELNAEDKYPELKIVDGDFKHNEISRPIVENASAEYGKFVTLLAHLGLKELPEEAASIIAKRFALSEAALVMAQSRAHHYNAAQELINNSRRHAQLNRPPIGGYMNVESGSAQGARPSSPTHAADILLSQVLSKK